MEKLKKNWKIIVIVVLILFGMNKCTVSCNRSTTINKQQTELLQKDSIIKSKTDSLNILKVRWEDAQSNKSDLVGVALDTKQELTSQVHNLESEIKTLKDKIRKLENENKQLKNKLNGK